MYDEQSFRSRFEPTGWTWLIFVGIYFALHVLTRTLVSPNLQMDEAEQLIFTQDWAWGYGSQPPLYNWIQKVLFSIFGVKVFTLSLLKNSLLFLFNVFFYLAALEIFVERRLAALATAAVFFMPQIFWESQRDQSHLVLATMCAAATLFFFLRICKGGGVITFTLFGIVAGMGTLAKYNYAFFLLALILAAATLGMLGVFRWKMVFAVAAFLLVTWPHFEWLMNNRELAASQSYKFKVAIESGASAYAVGLGKLAKAVATFVALPTLLFLPLLLKRRTEARDEWNRLLGAVFVWGLVLTVLLVLFFRVTYIRDRWLQPLLFAYPMFLVGLVAARSEARRLGPYFGLATAVAIVVLVLMNGVVVGANVLGRAHNMNVPFEGLAAELRKAGFSAGTILADSYFVGGNLKMRFPESSVVTTGRGGYARRVTLPAVVVWRGGDEPVGFLIEARQSLETTNWPAPRIVEIPCKNGPRHSERFGFVILEK